MRKPVAAIAIAALLAIPLGAGAQQSPTVQFPTTGWQAYAPTNIQCGQLSAVDFNPGSATDNAVTITVPAKNYFVQTVIVMNATHTLTTATAGLFTAASGGGTAIAADQALTVTGAAVGSVNSAETLTTTNATLTTLQTGTLYFRVGTSEGAAAKADVKVMCRPAYY